MSRVIDLLAAVTDRLAAARREDDTKLFTGVRYELGRYDFADLLQESVRAPAARVCLLRAKPVPRADAGLDLDVSVAIAVVAGRSGRADPKASSADKVAIELLDGSTIALMLDPYVGLTKLQAAEFGDQLVVVSDGDSENTAGISIALMEVKWRLLETHIARPAIQRAIETGRNPAVYTGVAINDGPTELPPLGFDPEDAP